MTGFEVTGDVTIDYGGERIFMGKIKKGGTPYMLKGGDFVRILSTPETRETWLRGFSGTVREILPWERVEELSQLPPGYLLEPWAEISLDQAACRVALPCRYLEKYKRLFPPPPILSEPPSNRVRYAPNRVGARKTRGEDAKCYDEEI